MNNIARDKQLESLQRSIVIADKEAKLLTDSCARLFGLKKVTEAWVKQLENNPAQADMAESFAARYGRFQDNMGDKVFPRLFAWAGENPATLIDNLNRAERLGLVESSAKWVAARSLRNRLVHEYMDDPEEMAEVLNVANGMASMLLATLDKVKIYLSERV